MAVDVATLSIKVDASGVATANTAMAKAATTAEMLTGMIGKLVAAFGALKLVEAVKESTMLAARYETLGVVMGVVGNNAGYTRDQMDGFQKALEKSGISAIESRNSLNMMASAQLDLTKSSELARAAQDTAVIAGINSSEAFQRMTRAIVSGEIEILKTMGMIVSWEAGYKRLAPTIGKVTANLTEHEKLLLRQQIVLEEAAKKAGAYEAAMGTAGKQLGSMSRLIENLQVAIGNVFLDAFTGLIRDLTGALEIAKKWMDENKTAVGEFGEAMKGAAVQGVAFTKMLSDLGGGGEGVADAVGFTTRLVQGLSFLFAGVTDIIRGAGVLFFTLIQDIGWAIEKMENLITGSFLNKIFKSSSAIKDFGAARAAELSKPFQTGNSALTAWYDSITAEKSTPSRMGGSEAGRIAQGNASRALAEAETKRAAAAKTAADAFKKLNQEQDSFLKGLTESNIKLALGAEGFEQYTIAQLKFTGAKKLDLENELKLRAITEKEQDKRDDIALVLKNLREETAQRRLHADAIRDSLDPMRAYAKELQHIADLEGRKGGLTAAEAEIARGSVWKRQREEMIKLRIESSETNRTIADGWGLMTNGMEDAFVKFATTGKASFKELTASILADMARLMANRAFSQLFQMGMNYLFGSMTTSDFTTSGGFSTPTGGGTGLSAGDLSPGVTGMAVPQGMKGGGGDAPVVNIVINSDTGSKTTSSSGQDSQAVRQWAEMMGNIALAEIVKAKRPGGVLNPVGAR